ncbi:MAG: putative nucleotide-diphospho-sugar transferase [Thermoleophilia bacterium]
MTALLPPGKLLRDSTAFFTFTTSGFGDLVRNLHASLVEGDPEPREGPGRVLPGPRDRRGVLEVGITAVSCDVAGLPEATEFEAAGFGRVVAHKYLLARRLLHEAQFAWWCDGDIVVTEPIVDRVLTEMDRTQCDMLTQYEWPKDVHNTGFWIVRSGAGVDRMLAEMADHTMRTDSDDQVHFNETQLGRDDLRVAALDHDEFACGNRFYHRTLFRRPSAPVLHFNYFLGRETKRLLMMEHGRWYLPEPRISRIRAGLRYELRALRKKAGILRRSRAVTTLRRRAAHMRRRAAG